MSGGAPTLEKLWVSCCANPRSAAVWEHFLQHFGRCLFGIARRVGSQWGLSGGDEIEDLYQDICLKVSQSAASWGIARRASEINIAAYLRAIAANAARDSLRTRFATKRGTSDSVPLEDRMLDLASGPEAGTLDRNILFIQIDNLIEASDRERAIFWLYYRQGLTTREIAAIPAANLTQKGVESLLHRITTSLRTRIQPSNAEVPRNTGHGGTQAEGS